MADEQEHTSDELELAQELPFWKAALAFIWGFTIGLIIGAWDMSAPDGICLHQIVGELEKIKKSMEEDMAEINSEEVWLIFWNHVYTIRELIDNINNA